MSLTSYQDLPSADDISPREALRTRWRNSKPLFMRQCLNYWMKPFLVEGLAFKGAMTKGSASGRAKAGKWLSLWLAPRGCGKSHVGTIGDILYDVCHDRDSTHLIVSETRDTAQLMLNATKSQLESNPNILEYYGTFKGRTWRTNAITVQGRKSYSKEYTIECMGVGGAAISRHVRKITCDDIVSLINSLTPGKRAFIVSWFENVLMPILDPGGILNMRGTKYYRDDLYQYIVETYGMEHVLIQRALLKLSKEEVAEEERKRLAGLPHRVVREVRGESYTSFFEERFPTEEMAWKYATMPVTFGAQYMNDITYMEGALIHWGMIRDYLVEPDWRTLDMHIGLDAAATMKGATSPDPDYSSVCLIGYSPIDCVAYVLRSIKFRKSSVYDILEAVLNIAAECVHRGSPVRTVSMETNAFGNLILGTAQDLRTDIGKRAALLPWSPKNQQTDKYTHLQSKTPWFVTGSILFNPELTELKSSLAAFPNAPHDDDVDAMGLALDDIDYIGSYDFRALEADVFDTTGAAL